MNRKIKIALIGYGKMGHLIEKIAESRGHEVVAKTTSRETIEKLQSQILDSDICIDFSHPECAVNNINQIARMGKNIVIGTTGWYDQLDEVRAIVEKYSIGLIYAPNFSLGINLFIQIVSEAAKLIDPFSQYDVGILEMHHRQKVDAPSGTAKAIATAVLNQMTRKNAVSETCEIKENEIHMTSLRCGNIPGTHSVILDSHVDTITLTHEARNREGLAFGAVIAGEWIQEKKGLFTVDDLFN